MKSILLFLEIYKNCVLQEQGIEKEKNMIKLVSSSISMKNH